MTNDSPKEKKVIAAFDFDGTILSCDSLPLFIRHAVPFHKLLLGSIMMSPFLILFKMRFITNDLAKERLFRIFLQGLSISQLSKITGDFVPVIESVVNPKALEKIRWHQERSHQVVIISASAEDWIRPWAEKQGIKIVLATHLETNGELLTGRLLSNNCHGPEKVKRLLERFPIRSDYILYAYGDSAGDKDLLNLADHPFYRKF